MTHVGPHHVNDSFQVQLLKMQVDCLRFEVSQLRTAARQYLGALPSEKEKWEAQLRVLLGHGGNGEEKKDDASGS